MKMQCQTVALEDFLIKIIHTVPYDGGPIIVTFKYFQRGPLHKNIILNQHFSKCGCRATNGQIVTEEFLKMMFLNIV